MLRGFRWQFLAFVMALVLFGVALFFRISEQTPPQPVATTVSTPAAATAVAGDTALPTATPSTIIDETPSVGVSIIGNDHYREALIGSIQRLNPLLAGLNPVDRDVSALIFEGLARTNAYGEPVPALADRWVIAPNGLEYIVYLRTDVMWHDGTPFTAADVLYTMSLLRDPRFPGAPELGAFWRTIETEQLGDHIVRFRLAQPLGAFLDRLTIGILPEHALRGTTADQLAAHPFNLTPIGTGPYQLARLVAPDAVSPRAVELVAAPVYQARAAAQGQPYAIKRVTFVLFSTFESAVQAVTNGEVDGLASRDRDERPALFSLTLSQGVVLMNTLEPTIGMIIYNWSRETTSFFREQRVRLALETGLDRSSAIERALPNLALRTDSPLISGSWAHEPSLSLPSYNPAVAGTLLATAVERMERLAAATDATANPEGAPNDSESLFTFSILTPDTPSLTNLANEIATQWSQLGLNVTVDSVNLELYQLRLETHDFDAVMVEYGFGGSGDPDVYSFWHEGQFPNGANYGGVSDRRISEILERARREPFNINRIADYARFQDEFIERAIALPIYNPLFTYAFSPVVNGVQLGYLSTAASRFENIGQWSIQR